MARVLPLLLLLVATGSFAIAQTDQTVTIPGRHHFSILVPAGYSFRVERDRENNAAVFMENPVWGISITAFLISDREHPLTTTDWQRNELISRVAGAFAQAKEADYNIQPLHPVSGTGVFCVFTDGTYKRVEDLPPGEFLHLTGGVRAWRGCFVYFQIMSNDLTSPEYQEAFGLFETSFTQ